MQGHILLCVRENVFFCVVDNTKGNGNGEKMSPYWEKNVSDEKDLENKGHCKTINKKGSKAIHDNWLLTLLTSDTSDYRYYSNSKAKLLYTK